MVLYKDEKNKNIKKDFMKESCFLGHCREVHRGTYTTSLSNLESTEDSSKR
jgi:hypothetical protein